MLPLVASVMSASVMSASVVFAAEPAELGAKPPSGADLTRIEDNAWIFERTVEMGGMAIVESGMAQDGRIQTLSWSASGQGADALAAWHAERAPDRPCTSQAGEQLSVRAGVAWRKMAGGAGDQRWVSVEQSEVPYASCDDLPKPKEPTPRAPPPPATAAPVRAFSVDQVPYSSVVRDPPPELARRIHVETTELSALPVRRIVGWCLATYPAAGTFRWESGSGVWKAAGTDGSPEASALAACAETLLAPMLPRGEITVHVDPGQ
jgi:hypothetical protein